MISQITRRRLAFHILGPIAVGGFLYLFWRTEDLRLFGWLDTLGLKEDVLLLRENLLRGFGRRSNSWIIYSLPAGLWMYSVVVALRYVWKEQPGLRQNLWLAGGVSMGVCSEVLQAAGLLPGTFDVLDLGVYVISFSLALFTTNRIGEDYVTS